MKLRHPLTRAVYTLQDDGLIQVETTDGQTGVFDARGRHRSGELKDADPHLLGWIGGPAPEPRGPLTSARAPARRAASRYPNSVRRTPSVPVMDATSTKRGSRSTGSFM